jgi:SAM-dependent methyltransferase
MLKKFGKVSKLLVSKFKGTVLRVNATFSFANDLQKIKKQLPEQPDFPITGYYPFLLDKYVESGQFVHHYSWQDLLIAQRIFQNNPTRHVDIGSRVDGFVCHVAAFRQIEILDIRPLKRNLPNVNFRQADLMQLPNELIEYTDSISSLHVIEHFGLGRYGDPIDVNGHFKALDNIYRILKKGGKFYFSVPVGKQGIMFNAHRTFAVDYLVRLLEKRYSIDRFWLIDDRDQLFTDKDIYSAEAAKSFGCSFGCGLFELTKL